MARKPILIYSFNRNIRFLFFNPQAPLGHPRPSLTGDLVMIPETHGIAIGKGTEAIEIMGETVTAIMTETETEFAIMADEAVVEAGLMKKMMRMMSVVDVVEMGVLVGVSLEGLEVTESGVELTGLLLLWLNVVIGRLPGSVSTSSAESVSTGLHVLMFILQNKLIIHSKNKSVAWEMRLESGGGGSPGNSKRKWKDLMVFEERLRQNMLRLNRSRRRWEIFLGLLIVAFGYFVIYTAKTDGPTDDQAEIIVEFLLYNDVYCPYHRAQTERMCLRCPNACQTSPIIAYTKLL